MRAWHVIQLVFSTLAAVAAVLCWRQVTSLVDVAPITEGQPATASVVYDPPLMVLSWVLLTVSGLLAVLGAAGLWRGRAARHPLT
jgi:hypothetical protein